MRLIIHAGTHKTATTTVQKIFANETELLKNYKIFYPNFEGQMQHSFLAQLMQHDAYKNVQEVLSTAFQKANSSGCDRVVLSGENFENFLVDHSLAEVFTSIAVDIGFVDFEYVFVQREPHAYLNSIYAEMSKHNCVINYVDFAETILRSGFASVLARGYNYFFVFDVCKFSKKLSEKINCDMRIIDFKNFVTHFSGYPIFENFVNDNDLHNLMKKYMNFKENNRQDPELVELRYVANMLNIHLDQRFVDENSNLITPIVKRRISVFENFKDVFKERFQEEFGT